MKKLLFPILFTSIFNLISCQQEDSSKTLEEYYSMGFPEINNAWSSEDIENAVESIEKLRQKDKFGLPKLNSSKSGKYFQKIMQELPRVSVEDSLRHNFQFRKFGRFQKLLTPLVQSYGPEGELQIYYSNESIEFEKLSIREVTNLAIIYKSLLRRMSDSIRKLNKENDIKLQGGILKVYEAALEINQPIILYSPEDKIELATVISENIDEIWSLLTPDSKKSLLTQIQSVSTKSEIKEVREIYSNWFLNYSKHE